MAGTSVIVVTVKPEPFLARCLESVADQAAEIVVVDNGSGGPRAGEIAAEHGAKLVRQAENQGFARGVNLGVAASTQEHVALLNDDAFADPGWLEGSEAVLRDPTVGAVVPKLMFAWKRGVLRLEDPIEFRGRDWRPYGRRVNSITVGPTDVIGDALPLGIFPHEPPAFWTHGASMVVFPLPDNREDEVRVDGEPVELDATLDLVNNAGQYLHPGGWCGDIGYGARDDGSLDVPADRFGACGAALVTRRETWDRVGGLAEDFFAYYEDVDWSWRLQLAGLRVRYEPSLVVRHVHSHTSAEGSRWWSFFVSRNRLLCFARNAPSRVAVRVLANRPPLPDGVARSLARRLPPALAHRRANGVAVRSRESVWTQWAGVDLPQ